MWRLIHSVLGIGGLLLIVLLALTGSLLSLSPAIDAFGPYVRPAGKMFVADALAVLTPKFSGIEKLQQTSAGAFVLHHQDGATVSRDYVDVRTGELLGPEMESPFFAFVKDLHRSLRLGDKGRLAAGIGASLMTFLCLSGSVLLVKRFGGIRAVLGPIRGTPIERLHATSGRLALLPLLIISLTGLYLTFITFQIVPNGTEKPLAYPESLQELAPVAAFDLAGLKQIRLADLHEVTYPVPGDWFDVYAVTINEGYVFIDQFTGNALSREPYNPAQVGLEWVTLIHTGEGAWAWGLVVGLTALSVPIFAISGIIIWFLRLRRGGKKIAANAPATTAETVLLVGSEAGTTWGFARYLHEQLTAAGKRVHLAPMNDLRTAYPKAQQLLVFTGTYGDGHAPKSANRFLAKLASRHGVHLPPFAVLGFGDKSFEHYCRFSHDVDTALGALNVPRLMSLAQIDRASAQTFAQWGRDLGKSINVPLELNYVPPRPATQTLTLVDRIDYGAEIGAPTAILRFKADGDSLPRHIAGDLIGIVAPGTEVARYYSLASSSADGHVEICVRHMRDGLCSGHLHALLPGECISGYIRNNPDFHMPRKNAPILMVGAGTGIAPFIGMIRNERGTRPIELYWGGRTPESDFLYEKTTRKMVENGSLTRFEAAFSRGASPAYVQDRIRANAEGLLARLRAGAIVMVCGGSGMAEGVRAEFELILKHLGTDVATLKRQRRYLEDIY